MSDEQAPAQIERLLLTVPEAAVALGIGRSTVYELLAAGEIPTVTIGRSRRIAVDALAAFVANLQAEASRP